MHILLAVALMFSCCLTHAEETLEQSPEWQAPPEETVSPTYPGAEDYDYPKPKLLRRVDNYFMIGTTISPKTKYKMVFPGIDQSYKEGDKSAVTMGIDSIIRFTPLLGMSLIWGFTQYKYLDETPSDKIIDLGLGPRIAVQAGGFEFWANAIAACAVNIWGRTSEISNGYIVYFSEDRSIGFEFSSRVGIDYNLMDLVKFRLQGGYTTAQYDVDMNIRTYPGMTEVATGSGRAQRSYWSALGGLALLF